MRSRRAFSLAEILFAVAIISVSLIGVSGMISAGGKQAVQSEDDREASDLLLSVKTCVESFGIPYLRSVGAGTKMPVWFGTGNALCLTGTANGSAYDFASAPKITLKNFSGSGTDASAESGNREYGAYFTVVTTGVPAKSVKSTVKLTNGSLTKSLDFRMDGK